MDKLALIISETFLYWHSIILMLAVAASVLLFLALYIGSSGNASGAAVAVPLCLITSLLLSRIAHWYCRSTAYESFAAAMTDWSAGGFALMGVFFGCLLSACLLRLIRLVRDLPEMLDCMALAGAGGIALGRLSFLYSDADRGMVVEDVTQLPWVYPVINSVTGLPEYRLATFMLQAMAAGFLFLVLLVFWMVRRKKAGGDTALLFFLCYGASQAICDSTRYDSLFLRSNGFVSAVQILGLVAMVTVIAVFSLRLVRNRGWKRWYLALWAGELAALGGAGFMEYYVQRHGDQALLAYSVMALCLTATVLLAVWIRGIATARN